MDGDSGRALIDFFSDYWVKSCIVYGAEDSKSSSEYASELSVPSGGVLTALLSLDDSGG